MREIVLMIIHSNPFSRSGLRQTLSQQNSLGIMEIMECDPGGEGNDAITEIAESSPDVVLLDIGYSSLSGLELGRSICRKFPGTRVVMLSDNPYDNDDEIFEVIKTGAVAYLRSKHCTATELIETVTRASRGEYPINDTVNSRPKVARRVLSQFQDMASMGKPIGEITTPLTPKEGQVLTLIADGNSNKQIASNVGASEQTIKNHVSAILRKLNANDRAHAVFIAISDGLISIRSGHDAGRQGSGSPQESVHLRSHR